MKKLVCLMFIIMLKAGASDFEQAIRLSFDVEDPVPTEIFKIRDKVELHYFAPVTPRERGKNPAFMFIHGGGWRGGNPTGSYRWCRYLAEHGVSAFTVRYQLASENLGIEPTQCVKDVKTAMRWIRANAKEFGIDPHRVAVSGHSAGGHLSAALATIEGYNDPGDDLAISIRPNLLLMVSPVMDNGPGAYGNGHDAEHSDTPDFRVRDFWRDFSPVHNLNNELPSSLVVIGDKDPLIQLDSVAKFGRAVVTSGSDFKWIVFPNTGHGLTSQVESYLTPYLLQIYYEFHAFLSEHGYMPAPLSYGDGVWTPLRQESLSAYEP